VYHAYGIGAIAEFVISLTGGLHAVYSTIRRGCAIAKLLEVFKGNMKNNNDI
jgi:hypothetical protein